MQAAVMAGAGVPIGFTPEIMKKTGSIIRKTLLLALGQRDSAKRLAAVQKLWAPEGTLTDGEGVYKGHAEIDRAAGSILQRFPEFTFSVLGEGDEIPGAGRIAWAFGVPGETPAATGQDVVLIENGLIFAHYRFLDGAAL